MMAMVIDDAGIIDPIEISNSPAIISNPMGMAMMPSDAATFNQLAAPLNETKFVPPKAAKNTNTAARPRKDPVSGRRSRWPNENRWVGLVIMVFLTKACGGVRPTNVAGRTRGFAYRNPAAAPAMVASTLAASTMPGPVSTGDDAIAVPKVT